MRYLTWVTVGLFVSIGWRAAWGDPLIPVEKFAQLPVAEDVRLSPDGNKIAFISSVNGNGSLVVADIGGTEKIMNLGDYKIEWVYWKSNTRLVMVMYGSTEVSGWAETLKSAYTRTLAVDVDGTHLMNIGSLNPGKDSDDLDESTIVSMLPDDTDHILQQAYGEVYRVDVRSGEHKSICCKPGTWGRYLIDSEGKVRLSSALREDRVSVKILNADKSWWDEVWSGQPDQFYPLAFVEGSHDRIFAIATEPTSHRHSIWVFDTSTKSFVSLLDDDADEKDLRAAVVNGKLISYRRRDGSTKYLSPVWEKDKQSIRAALKGALGQIVDRTDDGSRVLFQMENPFEPASWFLLDRRSSPPQLSPILTNYSDLDRSKLGTTKQVTYKARDGLDIPAYLTLPPGASDGAIPFVILPHGGPNACDTNGFNYEVQFLASRGYGVLQPEFRGSACFGREFEEKGFGQWGFAMQDDITDGTRWLIDQHLADPSRICIVGGSYGGYAALEGAIKEPDLYRCAAAWAPVTDLEDRRHFLYWHLESSDEVLRRLGEDKRRLKEASPARHADRIKIPVLLVHGNADFTVDIDESHRMEEALRGAHKPVEAIYLDSADHYLHQYKSRLAWLQALDRFLGKNLGPSTAGN